MADHTPLEAYTARPGQSLNSHLSGVADNVATLLWEAGTTAYGEEWDTVGKVLAWTHDAGKLTSWFQKYIETGDRTVGPTATHVNHGFVSALLTAHCLYGIDVSDSTQKAGFYAVAKHHGVLPDIASDRQYDSKRQSGQNLYDVVQDQLQNIDEKASPAASSLLDAATDGAVQWDDVLVDNPSQYSKLITPPNQPDRQFYETVLRAWSTLVCADKLDAAGIRAPQATARPPVQTVRRYVDDLPTGETDRKRRLNGLRSAAHEETNQTLQRAHKAGERLFRITLPTGFGKTLTGLRASQELASTVDGRVIYALPYTSIIDQIDTEIRDIYDLEPGDERYTIHHHLADTWTRVEDVADSERISDGSESLYAETWQSGVVLTTFVQLFESIAGPANVQSMKLPALQDSVIILDEPQALSLRWWSLVSRLTEFLRREYDATIILMTATQPKLFERDRNLPNPTPLTTQFEDCCAFISEHPRVEFELHSSVTEYLDSGDSAAPLDIDVAAQRLLGEVSSADAQTTLSIVNTIETAATLTEEIFHHDDKHPQPLHLGEHLPEFYEGRPLSPTVDATEVATEYLDYLGEHHRINHQYAMVTLTTRLRPVDRSILVAALRARLDDETSTPLDDLPLLTVSTQLIEAGVDVSFDRLYRDVAPIPSLVQAAGRCNREFGGPASTVTVWRLAEPDEDARIPSQAVYGRRSLLRPARTSLQKLLDTSTGSVIREAAMISTGVDEYYEALHHQRRTGERVSDLVEDFDAARGKQLRAVSLIDDSSDTDEVAVLVSDPDRELLDTYRQKKEEGTWAGGGEQFDALKHVLITMPESPEWATTTDSFAAVDVSDTDATYEITTGRGVSLH